MSAPHLLNDKLKEFKESKSKAAIYLNSSIRIVGYILETDETHITVTSDNDDGWCLISRSSIATLKVYVPGRTGEQQKR